MAVTVTTCPACGESSTDPQWCEHCGAPADTPGNNANKWFETGQRFETAFDAARLRNSEVSGNFELELVVDELLEHYASRRVYVASAVAVRALDTAAGEGVCDETLEFLRSQTYLLEESIESHAASPASLPEAVRALVREPIAHGTHGGHQVVVFVDNAGMTLEEIVDIARGQLLYPQVRNIFLAIVDAAEQLHRSGLLHLRLAPWNLRIWDPDAPDGFPHLFANNTSFYDPAAFDEETHDRADDEAVDVASEPGVSLGEETSSEADEPAPNPFAERGRTLVDIVPPLAAREAATATDEPDPFGDAPFGDDPFADDPFGGDGLDLDMPSGDLSEGSIFEIDPPEDDPQGADADAVTDDDAADDDEGSIEVSVDVAGEDEAGDGEAAAGEAEAGVAPGEGAEAMAGGTLAALFDGVIEFFAADNPPDLDTVVAGFSAPELMGRSRASVGAGTDVFALGMLLYYLVAGEVPPASVYTRHAPAIPARNFRPGFPPGLQAVISRATRTHPEERYPDIASLRDAFIEACELIEMRSRVTELTAPVMRLASDTHIGVSKKRRNPVNQDSVFSAQSDDGRFALVVVADGVSTASYGSGDLASRALSMEASAAWEEILPSYLMDEPLDDAAIIQDILNRANRRIVDYVNAHFIPFAGSPHEVMGSTALVAVIRDGVVTLASLGDSRVYLQRGSGIEQITIDHNLWTLSILEGMSADHALAMPHGDALARCLGTFVVQNGRLHGINPQADFFRFTVIRGDTVVLTTDGLIDFAGANAQAAEDNVLTILLAEADPALACLELILLANRGGGGDNIGLAIARFV